MVRCRGRAALVLLVLAILPLTAVLAATGGIAAKEGRLRVGEVMLRHCEEFPELWCGSIAVPLDRGQPQAATLDIGFGWRPAGGESRGTLVAIEGGPGYPTIDSIWYWETTFGPLLKDHDLLMVDARGTGLSFPLNCRTLQRLDGSQSDAAFHEAIAECGRQLDRTFTDRDGAYVHASDLFGTADAVDDIAAVIRALKVGKVDLYGVSYGSFSAQAFAARHPELLRSLTLDGTWPLLDANPWYPETLATLRFAFDAVCRRGAACAAAAPGSATRRLEALAQELAARPLRGTVPRAGGTSEQVTVRATDLAALAWSAGSDPRIYRDLDAAGRAALAGDPLPLLRLSAKSGLNGSLAGGLAADDYSVAHAVAVPCVSYPQLYDMAASPAERRQQFEAEVSDLPGDFFAPFARDDWLKNPIQDYDQCVPWPVPTHQRELAPDGLPLAPRSLPVLILAGDLDATTALAGNKAALAQIGPSARLVVFPSATHAVSQGDTLGCAASLVRAFVRDPNELNRLDTSCVKRYPEIHATGVFPRRLAEQPLPDAAAGNEATVEARRLAALAVATAGDAAAYPVRRGKKGAGLRGGAIAAAAEGPRVLTLRNVRYAEDARVSGRVTIPRDLNQPVVAVLEAVADDGTRVTLTARWRRYEPNALASIEGRVPGEPAAHDRLRLTMPAP